MMKGSAAQYSRTRKRNVVAPEELIKQVTQTVVAHSMLKSTVAKRRSRSRTAAVAGTETQFNAPTEKIDSFEANQSVATAPEPVVSATTEPPVLIQQPPPTLEKTAASTVSAPAVPVQDTHVEPVIQMPPVIEIPKAPESKQESDPGPRTQPAKSQGPVLSAPATKTSTSKKNSGRRVLAVFCYEMPGSAIGEYVARTAAYLANHDTSVHIFCRKAAGFEARGVTLHEVGDSGLGDLLESVLEFNARARKAFLKQFPHNSSSLTVMGHEWASIPSVQFAKVIGASSVLSLRSLEPQRSDMSTELSRKIHEIELQGLADANSILLHDHATADQVFKLIPGCEHRIIRCQDTFPIHDFESNLDPGEVKARVSVGPVDPMVLFVGNMDDRHGPDLLMKAVAPIIKNHKQARFVFVGEGDLVWPLRVHSRYLLLDYATRVMGHMSGRPLHELLAAADIIAVPSRDRTEDWPILAAWSAKRPVMATHQTGMQLIKHEQDGVLMYPNEGSCVWGIERLLFDHDLRVQAGKRGYQKVQERYGWNSVAEQLRELVHKQPEQIAQDSVTNP